MYVNTYVRMYVHTYCDYCLYVRTYVHTYGTVHTYVSICTYVNACERYTDTYPDMYVCVFYFSNRERALDVERARAKEIATLPPPKREIDMVRTYVCESSKYEANSTYSLNTYVHLRTMN